MRGIIATTLLSAALAAPTFAADKAGLYAVDGPGSRPCKDFTQAQAEQSDLLFAFAGWTGGFMTAVNVFREDTYDLTPFQPTELVLAKMAKYCAAHPDELYVNALGKLVAALMPGRLQQSSELVRVQSADQAVFIYAATLENLRLRLATDGYDVPKEAGSFTPPFAQAIATFQKDKGLPVSGLPDLATLNALFP